MSTTSTPQSAPPQETRRLLHLSRESPDPQRRVRALLIVLGVVLVALIVGSWAWLARQNARPTSPAAPVPTTLTVPALTTTYGDRELVLIAQVGAANATIGEGSVTFTILAGDRPLADPLSVQVSAGAAKGTVLLPSNLPAGTYTVRVDYGGGTGFIASTTTGSFTVAKRQVIMNLRPSTLTQTYDGTVKRAMPLTDPSDLAVAVTYSQNGQPVTDPIGAGTYQVTATIDEHNYQGSVSGTLTIERATPSVAWLPPASIVYGTPLTDAQLNATAALAGTFTYTPPRGTILAAGREQTLTATFIPPDTANYLTATVRVPLLVTPAPLTVSGVDATKVYGAPNPPITFTMRGLINGETAAGFEGAPQVTTTAAPGSPVGQYPIAVTQGQLRTTNYALTFTPGTLTVLPAPLTVAAHDVTRVYGAPDAPFNGTLTGIVNDDTINARYQTVAAVTSPTGQYPITPILDDPGKRLGNYQVTTTPGVLTVVPALSTANAFEAWANEGQSVTLQAAVQPVRPSIVTVDEGQVVFTIRQGATDIVAPTTTAVTAGVATTTISLVDCDAGTYTIEATYVGGDNFNGSVGTGALVISNVAPVATLRGPDKPITEGSEFTITLIDPFDPSAADRAAGYSYAFDRGDGWGFGTATPNNTVTRRALNEPGQLIRARVLDQHGAWTEYTFWVAVTNVAPTITTIAGPNAPVSLGSTVASHATFTDPGVLDHQGGAWNWGDGTTTPANIEILNGRGAATGSHLYGHAGIYAITLTISDDGHGATEATIGYVVVDEGDAGSAAGLVWFGTPTDPAVLAFVAGADAGTPPAAQAQVQFRLGDLHFISTAYDWSLISNSLVQIEGSGTINGHGGYHFQLIALDGQSSGGNDRFRLTITEQGSGALVYDSQPGAAAAETPSLSPSSGDIVIHPRQRDRINLIGQALADRLARLYVP